MRTLLVMCAVLSLCITTVDAGVTVDVGTHYLMADTANQEIEIYVEGDIEVQGLNLWVQISKGGKFGIDGPELQDVDLESGTIFSSSNTGQITSLFAPQVLLQTITTSGSSTVTANGLLATITIDTIGWFDNDVDVHEPKWELRLANTLNGDSDFAGTGMSITNGWIVIGEDPGYDPPPPTIPEPGSLAMLTAATGLLLRRR